MTPKEARSTRVGATVIWESSGERGKVTEKGQAGIRVQWDDGTDAIYLYSQLTHGLLHLRKEAK